MRETACQVFFSFLTVFLCLVFPSQIHAALIDDFNRSDNADVGNSWEHIPDGTDEHDIYNNQLRILPTANYTTLMIHRPSDESIENVEGYVDFNTSTLNNYPQILLRVTDVSANYVSTCYLFYVSGTDYDKAGVIRYKDNVWDEKWTVDHTCAADNNYRLIGKVENNGSQVDLTLRILDLDDNNNEIVNQSWSDTHANRILGSGRQGVGASGWGGGTLYYDNFTIVDLDDSTPPTIFLDAYSPDPSTDTTPTLTGTVNEANVEVSSVEYQMDGTSGSWSSCSADDGSFDEASEDFTCTVSPALSDGEHTIYVRATDSYSNTTADENASSDTFVIDTSGADGDSGSSIVTDIQNLPPSCTDTPPSLSPWLYGALSENSNSIDLYFTQSGEPFDRYAIEYGLASGDFIYGVDNINNKNLRIYTIGSLTADTTYYFRIRGGNGCAPGPWSGEISATTKGFRFINQLEDSVSPEEDHSAEIKKKPEEKLRFLTVKVVDNNQKPVVGAEITLHSKIQKGVTDKEGIVEFHQVEPGKHKLIVKHKDYQGKQEINIPDGDGEIEITIRIERENIWLSPEMLITCGTLLFINIILLALLIKSRKKNLTAR